MELNLVNCANPFTFKFHIYRMLTLRLLCSFPLRRDVEGCNNDRLKALAGVQHIYQAMDSAGYDVYGMPISRESAQSLLDRMIAAPIIPLKVLAFYIPNNCITNIDSGRWALR
jgi:hypothetical protein